MSKNPKRIDSKLNLNKSKDDKNSGELELHVLVTTHNQWRPDLWQSWDRTSSLSIGFIRTTPNITLFDLRSILITQLKGENLPDQYAYLRHVGRGSTVCSSRQERSLMARDFAPPFYPHPELCILSADDSMLFQPRYIPDQAHFPVNTSLPAIITTNPSKSPTPINRSMQMYQQSILPPVTPNVRLLQTSAPMQHPSLDRAKSPSLRSLQNHTEQALGQNLNTSNELMMAEINFLEAKKYLADAHARSLRNQYLHQNSVIAENGYSQPVSEDESEEKMCFITQRSKTEEERLREEEKREEEEEYRRQEEEEQQEREAVRQAEENLRQQMLLEEEKRREEDEQLREEEEKEKFLADVARRREEDRREEEEMAREEKIREEMARADWKRKAEEKKKEAAEAERQAEQAKLDKEDKEKRVEEEKLLKEEEDKRKALEEEERQKRIAEQEMKEFAAYEEVLKDEEGSGDDEADEAMKLIDNLTLTPRPWAAIKNAKKVQKIVRVPKVYTEEELEDVEYLKAKIMTYRGHRKAMETKHHDLLIRLTEMERDWDEEDFQEFESKWRPKCKEEEERTPQLYERNRLLRLELQMLYKQADTIISKAQAKKTHSTRQGMAFPSLKNNLRINLQKLQAEVADLRKRSATCHIKVEAEKSNREAVEKELKQLRQELINSKISSSVSKR